MLGAVIGDVSGSRFERHNNKSKEFELLNKEKCHFTDDTAMTMAIAEALMHSNTNEELRENAIKYMQEIGKKYPKAGYGHAFRNWIVEENPQAYNSWGNGAAMRISPVAYFATSIEDLKEKTRIVTEVSHNHEEGLKGAKAVALSIFLARNGFTKEEIKEQMEKNYYKINFTLDEIREEYHFNSSCQGSVPQALEAFFESTDFEDAIRCAVSIGGDTDTIAAITGSIAEAYYGIPENLKEEIMYFLPEDFKEIYKRFTNEKVKVNIK